MNRVSREVVSGHAPIVHIEETPMDLDYVPHRARGFPLFCSPDTAKYHKIIDSLASEKRDMKLWVNWKTYMPTIDHGRIAMEYEHRNLYLYPQNPKPPRQCFDELWALLQCLAHVHYGIDIDEDVFDLFLSQRLTSFGHFFLELETVIGSRLAIDNAKRIPFLKRELATERIRSRNAEAIAIKAAKHAGQVAAALLMIADEVEVDDEGVALRDLSTDAQLVLIHEFADYSH